MSTHDAGAAKDARRDRSDWGTRELELLYDAVRDELSVYNGIGAYGISDEAIRTLAWAVTSRIDCAFDVAWSPDWVTEGHPHLWRDDVGWHALCNECLQERPPMLSEDDVATWFDAHVTESHGRQSTR
ncbi:hypothetical protein [Microbacterium sp. MYb64]|uniref:hypothetical protein n=1 Tax=Microbacterium sp. MYb64 TaxID=1848691 RepID=UPI0015E41C22|nr:hypothetical protein [Microbacterium sp. MYb64]